MENFKTMETSENLENFQNLNYLIEDTSYTMPGSQSILEINWSDFQPINPTPIDSLVPVTNSTPAKNVKCPHGRQKSFCKECGGNAICQHGRHKYSCKECVDPIKLCVPHGNFKNTCRRCKNDIKTPVTVAQKKRESSISGTPECQSNIAKVSLNFDEESDRKPLNLTRYILDVTGVQCEADSSDLSFLAPDFSMWF